MRSSPWLRELRSYARCLVHFVPDPLDLAALRLVTGRSRGEVDALYRERRITRALADPPRVLAGPFEGMRYVRSSCGSALLPKLLGTYENELHPAIERLCRLGADVIVDVGAAEGYYVVGMARRAPGARVIGFETNRVGRVLTRRLARVNGVSARVSTRGYCEHEGLREALEGARAPVVICDIEGAELDLLDPREVPALRRCALLVELHEGAKPTERGVLSGRFDETHTIAFVPLAPRSIADLPPGITLDPGSVDFAMDEKRAISTGWLLMLPKGQ